MSVTDFSAARWERTEQAAGLKPREAVEAALREFPNQAIHAIVCIATPDNHIEFYQAGTYDDCGRAGLLSRCAALLLEADRRA